jgi:hypothetical protein
LSSEETCVQAAGTCTGPQGSTVRVLGTGDDSPCQRVNTELENTFVYALGKVDVRFPSMGVEKEFLQATGRTETGTLSDRQTFHQVLTQPENRYLTRLLCWIFSVEGIETYLLLPRNSIDYDLLVESVRPRPKAGDVDVVIGHRVGLAKPEMCNGLIVPVVGFTQVYSFDIDSLVQAIPRPDNVAPENFDTVSEELFLRIAQIADNAGSLDEHRALNYLAVRYPAIYATTALAHGRNQALSDIRVRSSRLSGTRRIVDVVFAFTHRQTNAAERYFVRVDVTEEFPFLVSPMSPYYVYDDAN